jgi:hypothetical protein
MPQVNAAQAEAARRAAAVSNSGATNPRGSLAERVDGGRFPRVVAAVAQVNDTLTCPSARHTTPPLRAIILGAVKEERDAPWNGELFFREEWWCPRP